MEEKRKNKNNNNLLLCMTEITLIMNVEKALSPVQGNEKLAAYLQANIHPTLRVFTFQKYPRLAGYLQNNSKE